MCVCLYIIYVYIYLNYYCFGQFCINTEFECYAHNNKLYYFNNVCFHVTIYLILSKSN